MQNPPRSFPAHTALKILCFFLLYAAGAAVSSAVSLRGATFPVIWLPSGIFLAALLLSNKRDWPAYLLAAGPASLLYSITVQHSPLQAGILYLTSALEALAGALLMDFTSKSSAPMDRARDVLRLILFTAGIASGAGALLGTALTAVTQTGIHFWPAWMITWMARALGVLAGGSLLLNLTALLPPARRAVSRLSALEFVILLAGLVAVSLFVFVSPWPLGQPSYLVLPFLIWAAIRFGPAGASAGGLVLALLSIWGTSQSLNGFASSDTTILMAMESLTSFLMVSLVSSIVLAALWRQNISIQMALRESEAHFRMLVENQSEGVAKVDQYDTFLFANPAAGEIFGIAPPALVGRRLEEFLRPEQIPFVNQQTELRRSAQRTKYELEIIQPSGKRRLVLVHAIPDLDHEGKFSGTFAVLHDITESRQVDAALRDSRARFQTMFDHSPFPIWEEDFSRIKVLLDGLRRDGVTDFRAYFEQNMNRIEKIGHLMRVLDVNQAGMQVFGFSDKAEFMAQVQNMLFRGPNTVFLEEILAVADGRTEFEMEGPNDEVDDVVRHHYVRWTVAPGYEKDYRRVIVSIIDVTERVEAEEQMRFMSTHDVLTGLYNRNFFEAELERLQDSRLEPINVMVIDVNGMKTTNDTYGHAAGDELLRRTARVLKQSFRKEDVIARIGGDEFVVLFHGNIPNHESVQRVRTALAEHNLQTEGPALSLAIGAAYGGIGAPLVDMFKRADQAMYQEKAQSRLVGFIP